MSSENTTAKDIFYQWLDQEPGNLELFLKQACGEDTELLRNVKELIEFHNSPDTFLEEPLFLKNENSISSSQEDSGQTLHASHVRSDDQANRDEHLQIPGYEITQVLGKGGMGIVNKAHHVQLNRTVALKIALKRVHVEANELHRFQSEAEAMAEIDHPNVVKVYEVGSHDGLPFLTMEFCPNGSLETLRTDEKMSLRKAAEVIEQIARGVAAAHAQGLIHRDLKPANVLIDTQGGLKVADFGLVKRDDGSHFTAPGMLLGTPSFMAPEQAIKQKRIGPAVDVWALGVMLYQLLTNEFPFNGEDALSVLHRVLKEEPTRPQAINPQVPKDLEVICLKCLSKEPAQRYIAANALADDLRRWLDGLPIEARPAGRVERAWKWLRRNPASAIAVLLLILGITVSTLFAIQARKERDAKEHARLEAVREKNQAKESRELTETFVDFLVEDFLGTARIRGVDFGMLPSGLGMTIEEALRISATRVATRFAGKPLAEAKARHAIGVTWEHIGNYDEAKKNLQRAAQIRMKALKQNVNRYDGHRLELLRDTINSFSRLGLTLVRAGESGEAIQVLNHALALSKGQLTEADPCVLNCRSHLALAYQAIDRVEDARRQFQEVIRLGKVNGSESNYNQLRFQSNLANAFLQMDQVKQAVQLYERIVEKSIQQFGKDHAYTRLFRYDLAKARLEDGKIANAMPVLEQELKLRKSDYGFSHPLTLAALNTLGKAYQKAGRLREAIPTLENAVLMIERTLGLDHPLSIFPRVNLGVVLAEFGNKKQAFQLINQALQTSVAKLGADHPTTQTVQNQLRKLKEMVDEPKQENPEPNKKDNALLAYDTAYKHALSHHGHRHPLTLEAKKRLGMAYNRLGRPEDATPLLEQWIKQTEEGTLLIQNDLALAYSRTGQLDKSIPIFEKCVLEAERQFSSKHLITLSIRANLGVNYKQAGTWKKAIHQFELILRHIEKAPPATKRQLEWVKVRLAEAYDATQSYSKAEPLRRSILETVQKRFGVSHRWTGDATEKLGKNLLYQKQYSEAELHFKEVLKIRKATVPNSWVVAKAELLLGEALLGQKKYEQAKPLLQSAQRGLITKISQLPKSNQDELLQKVKSLLAQLSEDKK